MVATTEGFFRLRDVIWHWAEQLPLIERRAVMSLMHPTALVKEEHPLVEDGKGYVDVHICKLIDGTKNVYLSLRQMQYIQYYIHTMGLADPAHPANADVLAAMAKEGSIDTPGTAMMAGAAPHVPLPSGLLPADLFVHVETIPLPDTPKGINKLENEMKKANNALLKRVAQPESQPGPQFQPLNVQMSFVKADGTLLTRTIQAQDYAGSELGESRAASSASFTESDLGDSVAELLPHGRGARVMASSDGLDTDPTPSGDTTGTASDDGIYSRIPDNSHPINSTSTKGDTSSNSDSYKEAGPPAPAKLPVGVPLPDYFTIEDETSDGNGDDDNISGGGGDGVGEEQEEEDFEVSIPSPSLYDEDPLAYYAQAQAALMQGLRGFALEEGKAWDEDDEDDGKDDKDDDDDKGKEQTARAPPHANGGVGNAKPTANTPKAGPTAGSQQQPSTPKKTGNRQQRRARNKMNEHNKPPNNAANQRQNHHYNRAQSSPNATKNKNAASWRRAPAPAQQPQPKPKPASYAEDSDVDSDWKACRS